MAEALLRSESSSSWSIVSISCAQEAAVFLGTAEAQFFRALASEGLAEALLPEDALFSPPPSARGEDGEDGAGESIGAGEGPPAGEGEAE